jgi:hypothetical protein
MKKVENELTLKCSLCNLITKTPEFALLGDILDCESCDVHLAYCDKSYHTFTNSPMIWKLFVYEVETEIFDEDGSYKIEIIKAEIL